MELSVLLFASYADTLGRTALRVEVRDEATVSDVLRAVQGMAPAGSLPPAAVAVNHEYAHATQRIRQGDEIAIIPPVAGG